MSTPLAPKKEIFGWAMFDFANSSYTTVIVTVVYSIVFPKLIVGDGPEYRTGNLLWSVALSVSYALVVLTVPLLGAVMDYAGHKKRWLFASYLGTVVSCFGLWLGTPEHVWLAFALVVLSNYAFAIGESFCASFLPGLGPPEKLGAISGFAWGLGYLGGLISTAVVLFGLGPQTPENFANMRLVGPVTGAFFLVAAIPTFLLVKDRTRPLPLPPGETLWTIGFRQLRETLAHLGRLRDLMVFFLSFFFAMAGLSIVISFAFIYGDQAIGWSTGTQSLMFILTQLTACGGAIGFGWLQGRIGDMKTYALTLLIWTGTVGLIAGTTRIAAALGVSAEHFFLLVGCCAGACLGATQSASRTLVALFAPPARSGEFFGLWGLFGKLASIFGLLSLGFLQSALGLENAILLCGVFFLVAFVITFGVDGVRAKAAALAEP